jgi:phosphoribosylformylglycinamidine synthase subunit PurQ / glutaminase
VRVEICSTDPSADGELPRTLSVLMADAEFAWHEPGHPVRGDAVIVAGPSREGAAPLPPATRQALRAFAGAGGAVLAAGAGVALLCESELLPGAVTPAPGAPEVAPVHVRVEGRRTSFTWAIPAGRILAVQAQTPRYRYTAPAADVAALDARGGVVLRYCDAAGGVLATLDDPAAGVAALCDETGCIVGVLGGLWPLADGLGESLGRQLMSCLRLL